MSAWVVELTRRAWVRVEAPDADRAREAALARWMDGEELAGAEVVAEGAVEVQGC